MSGAYVPPPNGRATQHDGTHNLAINNTWYSRLFTLVALRTTARFYKFKGAFTPISKHLILKTGAFAHLTEASTLKFIAEKTSIPVPRVYCSFVHKNVAYILMERIQGQTLGSAWPTLSEDDKETIFTQLRDMMRELRSLPLPPNTGVENCGGGSMRDCRIPRSQPRLGPFKTTQDFHLWLRDDLRPEDHPTRKDDQDWKDIKEMVAKQDGPWPPPVFTHADLNPSNIMVDGTRVVAIIDWEFSGWYPYYWEYTSVWYGSLTRKPGNDR